MENLNTKQASDFLENLGTPFSPGTLEVWRCLGKGPKFKRVARKIFYTRSDLLNFAKGQVVETIDSIDSEGVINE